jgi:hypothetical protein
MSQIEPTDLLCRSRREELSFDEQRRLKESLEHSFEVRLMSQMLSELESESSVRRGDDALLARITASALGTPHRAPRKRPALTMLLVAAAVLLIAGLAGAMIGGARPARAVEELKNFFSDWPGKVTKRPRPRAVLPITKPMPSQATLPEPAPSGVADVAREVPSAQPSPAPSHPVARRAGDEPKAATASSASALFARANLLRRQGHGVEAAGLYQQLLELYPSSREVGPTRLALAKYFQAKQPEQALAQYRLVAGGGGALRAEALWGISETATSLGERALSEQALADLIREFPDSPYAEVARARTTHGLP